MAGIQTLVAAAVMKLLVGSMAGAPTAVEEMALAVSYTHLTLPDE